MEEVYNPYNNAQPPAQVGYQAPQQQYAPQQAPYNPQAAPGQAAPAAPTAWPPAAPPVGQAPPVGYAPPPPGYAPAPAGYAPQPPQGGYAPPAGQAPPQAPPPPPVPQAPVSKRQFVEYGTQSGQPLEDLNLVNLAGYFHHMRQQDGSPKYIEGPNSVRLGFFVAKKESWTNKEGQAQEKIVWHRCIAWGDMAKFLVQVQDGTPIKIRGTITRFYPRDDQGNITGEMVDITVNKYDFP
jgi:hypothetical protein